MSIAIVKKEEMAPQYDANGFSRMEMLPGCEYSCRMRNPEREAGKSCFSLQTALQSRFSGAFEAENDENGCISAPRLK